jgi:hypothetical protein
VTLRMSRIRSPRPRLRTAILASWPLSPELFQDLYIDPDVTAVAVPQEAPRRCEKNKYLPFRVTIPRHHGRNRIQRTRYCTIDGAAGSIESSDAPSNASKVAQWTDGVEFLVGQAAAASRAACKSTRAARRALDKFLKAIICLTHKPISTIAPIPPVAAR